MIGTLLCLVALGLGYGMGRRSLGHGLSALAVVGYFYGFLRARFPDGGAHFIFDMALLGLYAAQFTSPPPADVARRAEPARSWLPVLIGWPFLCLALGPALPTAQPWVVQLVGLRAAILFLPCIALGARISRADMDRLALTIAILNVISLGAAFIEYRFGVESILPRNRNTDLIYRSQDVWVGNEVHYRIPSIFSHSHMYGGVMCMSLPFIAHGLEGKPFSRMMSWFAFAAAGLGVFLCGSRMPVVMLLGSVSFVLLTMRARFSTLFAVAVAAGLIAYLVLHEERLQRFETLADTEMVQGRVAGSVNQSFFTLLLEYPMGSGLATAFGTNVPYFLVDMAHPSIGIESEVGRILLEEGLPGLFIWIAFAWTTVRKGGRSQAASPAASAFGVAMLAASWVTGAVGAGLLCATPSTSMLLLLAGMRLAAPETVVAPKGLRNIARQPDQFYRFRPRRPAPTPATSPGTSH